MNKKGVSTWVAVIILFFISVLAIGCVYIIYKDLPKGNEILVSCFKNIVEQRCWNYTEINLINYTFTCYDNTFNFTSADIDKCNSILDTAS